MFPLSRLQCNGQFSKCRLKATVSLAYSGSCLEHFLSTHPHELIHILCHALRQALMAGTTGQSSIISSLHRGLVYTVMLLIPRTPTPSTTSSGFRFLISSEKFQPMIHYPLLD